MGNEHQRFKIVERVRDLAQNFFDDYKERLVNAADQSLSRPPPEFFYYYAHTIELLKSTEVAKEFLSSRFKMSEEDIAYVFETRAITNRLMLADHLFSFINPSYSQKHNLHLHPKQFPKGLNIIAVIARLSTEKLFQHRDAERSEQKRHLVSLLLS